MFGLGLGEILLVILVAFLVSPRDLPRVMRKIGEFFGAVQKIKREFSDTRNDIQSIFDEAGTGNYYTTAKYKRTESAKDGDLSGLSTGQPGAKEPAEEEVMGG